MLDGSLPQRVTHSGQELEVTFIQQPALEIEDSAGRPAGQALRNPELEIALPAYCLTWMRHTPPRSPGEGSSLTAGQTVGSGRNRNLRVRLAVLRACRTGRRCSAFSTPTFVRLVHRPSRNAHKPSPKAKREGLCDQASSAICPTRFCI